MQVLGGEVVRQRDHILNTGTDEVVGILEKLGISRQERVVALTIKIDAPNKFSFGIARKTNAPGTPPEFDSIEWETASDDFVKPFLESLGLIENEKVQSVEIKFLSMERIGGVTITKLADDRLLDLDWSKLARKEDK